MCVCTVAQSCPTLRNPMGCSCQASLSMGTLQARILEWVAMPSSRGSSQPRGQTWCLRQFTYSTKHVAPLQTFSHNSEFLRLVYECISSTLYSPFIPTFHPFKNLCMNVTMNSNNNNKLGDSVFETEKGDVINN